jgi:ubiquinone/menaquinone biosynthesis C-methylase UbiE
MQLRDDAWLGECPDRFRPALRACANGEAPATIALMRLLIEAAAPQEVEVALGLALLRSDSDEAARRLERARQLLRDNPQAFATVKAVLNDVEHRGRARTAADGVARWAAAFDRMAQVSPEGSVALYTFGNPDLLRAATAEVVARLDEWGVLGRDATVLEIGCGIGRFVEALAPKVGRITGIDISSGMIERARQRCSHLSNARLRITSGRDLSAFADETLDLVLAADVFPYLVQAGLSLAEGHLAEAARVLRPGAHLAILNFSYRDDPEADRADLDRIAACNSLSLMRIGRQDFSLWDAATFLLVKDA